MAKANRTKANRVDANRIDANRTKAKSDGIAKRAQAAAAAPPRDDDDPVPEDIDEFRRELARRILTLLGLPRRCHDPACRRAKRCVGPDMRCQRDYPAPKLSPEKQAAMMAALQRALKRRLSRGREP
jgi:hypothetical protein